MATTRKRTRRPTLPGEILAELYLAPHEISIAKFAEASEHRTIKRRLRRGYMQPLQD